MPRGSAGGLEAFAASRDEVHPAHRVARRAERLDDLPGFADRRIEENERFGAGQGGERLLQGVDDDQLAAGNAAEHLDEPGFGEGETGPVDDAHQGAFRKTASSASLQGRAGG